MRYLLFVAMIFLFSVSYADVYMQKDAAGNVMYTDTPSPGAKKVSIQPLTPLTESSAPATPAATSVNATTPSADTSTATAETAGAYSQFFIDSPLDQQTINNQRDVPITLGIKPDLKKGDKIQLYLDGNPYGQPAATTTIQISNMDRGSHTIYAVLLDNNNNVLKQSQSITIFIHYAALGGAS